MLVHLGGIFQGRGRGGVNPPQDWGLVDWLIPLHALEARGLGGLEMNDLKYSRHECSIQAAALHGKAIESLNGTSSK